jgi:hypothetical protein
LQAGDELKFIENIISVYFFVDCKIIYTSLSCALSHLSGISLLLANQ